MSEPFATQVSELIAHRAPEADIVVGGLRREVEALRRIRDGEARRLEARIMELERLVPELQRRARRADALIEEVEREREARLRAERASEELRSKVDALTVALSSERERNDRLLGRRSPSVAADPYRVWEQRFRERASAAEDDRLRRLHARIDRQLQALEEREARIAELSALVENLEPSPIPDPDDLTSIRGIGPVIAGILNEHGITSLSDVAALDGAQIERLGELMPIYPGRINADDWVGQAKALLGQREERHSRRARPS